MLGRQLLAFLPEPKRPAKRKTPAHAEKTRKRLKATKNNKLQLAWSQLTAAIQAGVDAELWKPPDFNLPATIEEVVDLETELDYSIGSYSDLLLLANGVNWCPSNHKDCGSVVFGGTGATEDGVLHAFNYSGQAGRALFKKNKQAFIEMLDYDMCVNVFEVSKGRVAQDDRECGEHRMLADSLTAWLQNCGNRPALWA